MNCARLVSKGIQESRDNLSSPFYNGRLNYLYDLYLIGQFVSSSIILNKDSRTNTVSGIFVYRYK